MWNRELKFTPAEIIGLLVLVEQGTDRALRSRQSPGWAPPPYDLIPAALLVYESFRLMHTLVTDTQPKGWPNAVEEVLLYGLCQALVTASHEDDFAAEILQTVNALRRHAGRRPLRSLKHLHAETWENEVLDVLLFSDRDWQMANADMIRHPELCAYLSIGDHYFDVAYRQPTARELQAAQAIFQEILARARSGRSAEGLGLIPPLHNP
jgi:hypothetical protein